MVGLSVWLTTEVFVLVNGVKLEIEVLVSFRFCAVC